MKLCIVVAQDLDGAIGSENSLPWHLPSDLKYFRELTTNHVVIVGRKTHESILARLGKPLPNRITVVVSSKPGNTDYDNVTWDLNLADALATAKVANRLGGTDEVYVIGGAQLYAAALPFVEKVYLTIVTAQVGGDTYLPVDWLDDFIETHTEPEQQGPDDEYPYYRMTLRRRRT